jgi:uncharacterized protein YjbI with pentapeptide repeats
MIKYPIYDRWKNLLFVAKINAKESQPDWYKKRLAVLYALKRKKSLFGANLSGADLSCLNLQGVDFRKADLSHTNMEFIMTAGAKFHCADMRGAILNRHDLTAPEFKGAIFS